MSKGDLLKFNVTFYGFYCNFYWFFCSINSDKFGINFSKSIFSISFTDGFSMAVPVFPI